jgi:Family of unknown function (DUF6152)
MNISSSFLALVTVCLCARTVYAHHSFAEFNEKETITVKGVVTEWRLVNPHAMMTFDATDANGVAVEWKVQFDGRTHIGRAGWTDDTIKPGETITVTGNPARSGSPYMFFISAIKGDGTELIRPFKLSIENAEEERRLRQQQRDAK